MPAPAAPTGPSSVPDLLHAEFRRIRANVSGVHGTVVATSDGFLVAHDVPDLDSTDVAALLAASRSLASRGVALTGRGQFREVIARGSHGYLAVYAAGDNAIVGVIGTAELNVAMLHYLVHDTIAQIAVYAREFSRWASREPAPGLQGPGLQGPGQLGPGQLGPGPQGPQGPGPQDQAALPVRRRR